MYHIYISLTTYTLQSDPHPSFPSQHYHLLPPQTNPQLTPHRYHLIAKARNFHGFDLELMSTVKIITASPKGEVEFELVSSETYGNLNNVMHGGAAALIFDMCTTSALGPVARPGFWE